MREYDSYFSTRPKLNVASGCSEDTQHRHDLIIKAVRDTKRRLPRPTEHPNISMVGLLPYAWKNANVIDCLFNPVGNENGCGWVLSKDVFVY